MQSGDERKLVVSGVLDALSAGILIWTGLVEVGIFIYFYWLLIDEGFA